jgi:hypothetical protein
MPRIRSAVGLAVLCVAVQLGPARAATAGRSFAEEAFQSLLKAIEAHAIDQFTALGDEGFKAMPPGEFDALAAKFAPMLRSGYRASYLGEFKQKDTIVHYWKLTFTSDSDDYLAKLGVRDGKLRGFLIQRP